MLVPGTVSPPQYCLSLPCNPGVVNWHYAGMGAGVEEWLILVCKRDVYYDRCEYGKEAGAKGKAQLLGVLSCEVFVYKGGVDVGN